VTRVLGEPAAVLYRLGSIINHWNLTKKKSRKNCSARGGAGSGGGAHSGTARERSAAWAGSS
jgi:hypothetical protein